MVQWDPAAPHPVPVGRTCGAGCVGTFLDGQMEARRCTLAQGQALPYLKSFCMIWGKKCPIKSPRLQMTLNSPG